MSPVLGGMSPARFLREHWQKKPLLIRQGIPGFRGLVTRDDLFDLAALDGVAARAVLEARGRFALVDDVVGLDMNRLPATKWTVLVQGIEGLVDGGWELLSRFDFIPAARVDDLMVSYAAPGGSVGPHVDQYDVFLLQGEGRRRWRIGRALDDDDEPAVDPRSLPLHILRDFDAVEDHVLEPGDMLYLPPRVPHWGTAVDACFTYSIGFLAPSHEALVQNFLVYFGQVLEERMAPGLYADPGLELARDRFAVGDDMAAQVERTLREAVSFTRDDVGDFLGRLLTGPKPSARFTPPARPPSLSAFAKRVAGRGTLRLALPSRGLVRGRRVFVNGAALDVGARDLRVLHDLVAARAVSLPVTLADDVVAALHDWLCAGWLTLGSR